MKRKLLFTLCLTFVAPLLFAQGPTFTSSFNPYAGFSVTLQQTIESGVPDGNAGANQVWNYSLVDTPGVSAEPFTFIEPDATTYTSDFPSATLAAGGNDDYTYYNTSSSNFSIIGSGNPDFIETLSPPEMEWQYPFSYGTVQTSTFAGSYAYNGFNYAVSGLDTLNADGYGTLIINGNFYSNALRFIVSQYTQTIITGAGSGTSDVNITTIYYAIPSYQYPLLEIQHIEESLDGSSLGTWRAVAYTTSAPTGISSINPLVENLNVFPNPSYSQSAVSLNLKEASTVNVYVTDILGRKVKNITSGQVDEGYQSYSFETSNLAKGTYLVTVEVNGSVAGVRKLEIE